MEIVFYMPCKPDWLCEPFAIIFSSMVAIGILLFIRLIYKEYQRLKRTEQVLQHRKTHYTIRKNMDKPYQPIRRPRNKKR
jgi:uncharacterized membrane protein YcjF (UPF0283 family)